MYIPGVCILHTPGMYINTTGMYIHTAAMYVPAPILPGPPLRVPPDTFPGLRVPVCRYMMNGKDIRWPPGAAKPPGKYVNWATALAVLLTLLAAAAVGNVGTVGTPATQEGGRVGGCVLVPASWGTFENLRRNPHQCNSLNSFSGDIEGVGIVSA